MKKIIALILILAIFLTVFAVFRQQTQYPDTELKFDLMAYFDYMSRVVDVYKSEMDKIEFIGDWEYQEFTWSKFKSWSEIKGEISSGDEKWYQQLGIILKTTGEVIVYNISVLGNNISDTFKTVAHNIITPVYNYLVHPIGQSFLWLKLLKELVKHLFEAIQLYGFISYEDKIPDIGDFPQFDGSDIGGDNPGDNSGDNSGSNGGNAFLPWSPDDSFDVVVPVPNPNPDGGDNSGSNGGGGIITPIPPGSGDNGGDYGDGGTIIL